MNDYPGPSIGALHRKTFGIHTARQWEKPSAAPAILRETSKETSY